MSGDWLVSVVWILASATTLIHTSLLSYVPMATMLSASHWFLVLDTYNLDGNWMIKCYDSPFVALCWVAWVNHVAVSVSLSLFIVNMCGDWSVGILLELLATVYSIRHEVYSSFFA